MFRNSVLSVSASIVIAVATLGVSPGIVQAQNARQAKPAVSGAFTEAMARAKETNRPVVVFGVSEGCSRCAGLKQGMATQSELQLLLTQYVTTEVPFGGREFAAIFDGITKQEPKYRQAIGAPSVFIFTAAGEAVYAGPNNPNGMQPGDEFKKLLITGIEKNGGLRGSAKGVPTAGLAGDVAKARKLLGENQPLAAARTLAKHVSTDKPADELAELTRLTGLTVARSKAEEQLDSLVEQLSEKGLTLLASAVAAAKPGDAVPAAVKLAELERAFETYPAFAGKFDAAWSDLLAQAETPNLRDQAELIAKAREAEAGASTAEAIAAYELVSKTYPGTKAAELSAQRVRQLQGLPPLTSRLWKSKSGQFTVNATLRSFDGKTAQLRTEAGKTISVPIDALSAEDQKLLKSAKPQE